MAKASRGSDHKGTWFPPLARPGSYDLYFWKQNAKCELPPKDVLDGLLEEHPIAGVELLPTEEVITRIQKEFPDVVAHRLKAPDCPIQLFGDEQTGGCFVVMPCRRYLCIESHQATPDALQRLFAIAQEFGCRLYDPHTDIRYDGRPDRGPG